MQQFNLARSAREYTSEFCCLDHHLTCAVHDLPHLPRRARHAHDDVLQRVPGHVDDAVLQHLQRAAVLPRQPVPDEDGARLVALRLRASIRDWARKMNRSLMRQFCDSKAMRNGCS